MTDQRRARTACMEAIEALFPTFGGGKVNDASSPLAQWTKDEPLMFALGVPVEGVVDIVIAETRRVDALERKRRRERKAARKSARIRRRFR